MSKQKMSIEEAAEMMIKLVDAGWEYPDVSTKVSMATGFDTEELSVAYDEAQ